MGEISKYLGRVKKAKAWFSSKDESPQNIIIEKKLRQFDKHFSKQTIEYQLCVGKKST